jgi:hypothetical protein
MKRTFGNIAASAILLSSIFGAAPASADPQIFPSNANGVDNSGITAVLCEDSVYLRLPQTVDPDPDTLVPGQGLFNSMTWNIYLGDTYLGQRYVWTSFHGDDSVFNASLADEVIGDSATFTLEAWINDGDFSDSFDFGLEVDNTEFAGGTGTANSPFLISNAAQLNMMRCHEDKYFALTKDIDLAGIDWIPVGNDQRKWAGALDGRGHSIKNLTVKGLTREAGLFGNIDHYSINNLTLRNFDIEAEYSAGGLFGEARYGSIANVKVLNSTVSARDDMGLLGGKVDYRTSFDKITVSGQVLPYAEIVTDNNENNVSINAAYNVGGVLGYDDADGTTWTRIKADVDIVFQELKSYNSDQVFDDNDLYYTSYVGGLVGESGESASYQDVELDVNIELPNSDFVPSYAYRVGGVFGDAEESFADKIDANVKITDLGNGDIRNFGGFVGEVDSFVASNSKLHADITLEIGGTSEEIGGFAGNTQDYGFHDINSTVSIDIVRVGDSDVSRVGGFIGYDDEGNITGINSKVDIKIADGNGTNNSLNATLVNPELTVYQIGGFAGRRDDRTSYTAVSSDATIQITGSPTSQVGGFVGANYDSNGLAIRNVISRGVVTVPAGSSSVAAFIGLSGTVRLSNVLISTKLNTNGSTENIGTLVGEIHNDYLQRSRFFNTFTNSGLGNPADVEGVPSLGATAKQMKSAKFLKANGFDLTSVFRHQDGQLPAIWTSLPMGESATSSIRLGRTNKDTSISVGAAAKDGSRSYFVNLPNANARQVATLMVIRSGKAVKQIHAAALNGVGNWYTTSKFALKIGDTLRVEIGGQKIRTLKVRISGM